MANSGNSDPDVAEKGEVKEIEDSTNHHSWDNHTSFNKYPTHEPGYENKVCFLAPKLVENH
jgi:hypothetical protein